MVFDNINAQNRHMASTEQLSLTTNLSSNFLIVSQPHLEKQSKLSISNNHTTVYPENGPNTFWHLGKENG